MNSGPLITFSDSVCSGLTLWTNFNWNFFSSKHKTDVPLGRLDNYSWACSVSVSRLHAASLQLRALLNLIIFSALKQNTFLFLLHDLKRLQYCMTTDKCAHGQSRTRDDSRPASVGVYHDSIVSHLRLLPGGSRQLQSIRLCVHVERPVRAFLPL